jgi:hypothetical protein
MMTPHIAKTYNMNAVNHPNNTQNHIFDQRQSTDHGIMPQYPSYQNQTNYHHNHSN